MPWRRSRRSRSAALRMGWGVLFAVLGITLIAVGWLRYQSARGRLLLSRWDPADQAASGTSTAWGDAPDLKFDPAFAGWLHRPVYPYSVVPGGIASIAELRQVLLRDPVAAGHYTRFDVIRSRILQLQVERMAYISYRMKDRIYWTSRKVRLPRGERVVTDGVNYARARCGNRISEVPQSPTSPQQPPEGELETPLVFPNQTLIPVAFISLSGTPSLGELSSPAAASGAQPPETIPQGGMPPPIVLPYGGSPPGTKGKGSPYPVAYPGAPCKPHHPRSTATPEPSTVLLISTGLGIMALGIRRRSEVVSSKQ
jgi:hypothetical protein